MAKKSKKSRTFKFGVTNLNKILYPTSNQETLYHDAESTCLKLRVTKKQKTFYYIRKINNKTIKIKLGVFSYKSNESLNKTVITVDSARKLNKEKKELIKSGKYENYQDNQISIIEDNVVNKFTVNDAMEEFYDLFKLMIKIGQRKPNSLTRIKQNYKNHIQKHLGNKEFHLVTPSEVKDLLFAIQKKSYNVYNKCLTIIKSLYNKIIDHRKLLLTNPTKTTKTSTDFKKIPSKERTRYLQPSEILKFFESVREEKQIYQDIVVSSLLLAQRKSNILSMKWMSIDLKNGLWHLSSDEVKNKEPHVVPIDENVLNILKRRFEENDGKSEFVFPSTRSETGHISEKTSKGSFWHRIRERAGLWHKNKDLRLVFHDLRRTLGSYMALNNSSLQIIGKTLGHSGTSQTKIYARLNVERLKIEMEKATDSILENIEGENELIKSMGFNIINPEKAIQNLKNLFTKITKTSLIKNNPQYLFELKGLLDKITKESEMSLAVS